MKKSVYLVHDCETGGLDPKKNPITQYACVVLDYKTLKEIDRFETFVQPYDNLVIEKEALEHTMVTMADIRNGISGENLASLLGEFYSEHQVSGRNKEMGRIVSVGHNVTFDHGFIEYLLRLYGDTMENYFQPNFIDTLTLAKMTWGLTGDEKLNLTACCERTNITLTDAHGAMNDVEATADLFRWFVKKMRSKAGASISDTSIEGSRKKGTDFFEFKCGK